MGEKLANEEGFLSINGINHWYKIEGAENDTIPIMIIHGGPGGNQYTLEHTIGPKLAQKFTVIYYEQRGGGRSEKPKNKEDYSIHALVSDLEELRRGLQIEKMYLLGISFGSWIAMEYTLAYSDRVEKLILQGPVDGNWKRLSINQVWGLKYVADVTLKKKIIEILGENETVENMKDKIWSIVDKETIARLSIHNNTLIEEAISIIRESGKYGFNEDFHNAITKAPLEYPTLLDKIKNINTPTKVIVGLYDRNSGVEMSRDIVEAIKGSTLSILYNSAHYPEYEELENYSKEIVGFINK